MGSFWSLETKYYNEEQNLNFTQDAMQKNALWISKRDILKNTKKLVIFKSLPLPFGFTYFNETWLICLVVLSCYQEYIRMDLLENI